MVEPDNADALAADLFGEFRTLARLFALDSASLARVTGAASPVPLLLHAAGAAAAEAARAKLERVRISPHSDKVIDYLKRSMGGLPYETLRILFLDGAHRLLTDEQMHVGTIDRLTFYPRTIFRRAIELEAAAIIIVHNHPSGNAEPSAPDLAVTDQLVAIATMLDLEILGHIIVTASTHRHICTRGQNPRASGGSMNLRSERPGASGEDPDSGRAPSSALANARRTIRRRLLRNQLLGAPDIFGEPAWNMVLEVFVHQSEGRPISTSSLCIASGLSMTSGLRLLQRMEKANLVVREADPGDGRRNFIVLTPAIFQRLVAFFAENDE